MIDSDEGGVSGNVVVCKGVELSPSAVVLRG